MYFVFYFVCTVLFLACNFFFFKSENTFQNILSLFNSYPINSFSQNSQVVFFASKKRKISTKKQSKAKNVKQQVRSLVNWFSRQGKISRGIRPNSQNSPQEARRRLPPQRFRVLLQRRDATPPNRQTRRALRLARSKALRLPRRSRRRRNLQHHGTKIWFEENHAAARS